MEPRTSRWISELGLDEEACCFVMQQKLSTLNQYYRPQELISTSHDKADQHGLFFMPDGPLLLSFNQSQAENIIYEEDVPKDYSNKRKSGIAGGETEKKKMNTGLGQAAYALDHIVAERRRREKLSQTFIALAAIIPGLRKMDKASVLGDAIKHIKELLEMVKILEDKIEKKTVEIATMNKKPCNDHFNYCESPTSSLENNIINGSSFDQKLHPHKVDVKLCEKAVLVKIHCEKHKGVLAKVISMIEELNLKVNNFSAMPFLGSSFLDITMTAQVEEGCSITVEGVAKKLTTALSQCN